MSMQKALLKVLVVLAAPALYSHAQTPLDTATSLRLRYVVLDQSRLYPRPEPLSSTARRDEIERAVRQFPEIQEDRETFEAITQHIGLPRTATFGEDEKLLVYRDYVDLQAIHLEPWGNRFRVTKETANDLPSCTDLGPIRAFSCGPSDSTLGMECRTVVWSGDLFIDREGRLEGRGDELRVRRCTFPPSTDPNQTFNSDSDDSPRTRIEKLVAPELRYGIEEHFGRRFFYCRGGGVPFDPGMPEALKEFPEIQKDTDTFLAITKHSGLEKITEFSDIQKLTVYGEYWKLAQIGLEPLAEKYKFRVRVLNDSAKRSNVLNGFSIEGLIDQQGTITILRKEPATLICPICLPGSTRIDTPGGPIAVKDLQKGTLVWTLDAKGHRVAEPVLKTTAVSVPFDHLLVHLVLKDGRELWVSPNHPTVDGRTVGQLKRNAAYDGTTVASVEVVRSEDPTTYDLLPAGDTGFYWANGILLASTLR